MRYKKGERPSIKTEFKKGQTPWNKGLEYGENTKKKISNALKEQWKNGLRKSPMFGKKHSEGTKKKMSKANIGKHSGNKCPFWKGGISKINRTERTNIMGSLEYRLWRKSVLERDDFTCQKYKIKGGALRAHHINNYADFPELRFAIDNGIILSEKAHREFHKKYGNKNNTKGQLEEFLNNK